MSGRTSTRKKRATNKGAEHATSIAISKARSAKATARRNRKKIEQPAMNALLNAFSSFGIKTKNIKQKNNSMGR